MSWDWQVFCEDTITREATQSCFGQGGDITYLDWLLSAWGWTVSVSLSALLLALLVGAVVGTMRTLPNRPWVVRAGNAWSGQSDSAIPTGVIVKPSYSSAAASYAALR